MSEWEDLNDHKEKRHCFYKISYKIYRSARLYIPSDFPLRKTYFEGLWLELQGDNLYLIQRN